jgi:hypothetical protein
MDAGPSSYRDLETYVRELQGKRAIKKVLIANNGIAAVKAIRFLRKWSYEVFGNEHEVGGRLWGLCSPLGVPRVTRPPLRPGRSAGAPDLCVFDTRTGHRECDGVGDGSSPRVPVRLGVGGGGPWPNEVTRLLVNSSPCSPQPTADAGARRDTRLSPCVSIALKNGAVLRVPGPWGLGRATGVPPLQLIPRNRFLRNSHHPYHPSHHRLSVTPCATPARYVGSECPSLCGDRRCCLP